MFIGSRDAGYYASNMKTTTTTMNTSDYKFFYKAHRPLLVACFGISFLVTYSSATVNLPVSPSWYGDDQTTFQSYTFATDSTSAAPDVDENANGNPEMLVNYVPDTGVGTGYQDPEEDIDVHRVDGAWDLGPDGDITYDIPVAPPVGDGPGYVVDVFVGVVYESGLFQTPNIVSTPNSAIVTSEDPNFEQDGIINWGLLTGETNIEDLQNDSISVLVDATGDDGSLVDTVEIHTRYEVIPEPKVFGLIVGMCLLVCVPLVRRRM